MVNYIDSFKRPFLDIKKLVIGILLSIIPIVNFLAIGYYINAAKSVIKSKPSFKLPEWENWTDLFVKGLLSIVINIVYSIPALIALFASFRNIATMTMLGGPNVLSALTSPSFLIGGILLLIAAYLTPLAVIHYINTNNFKKAFDFRYVLNKTLNTTYLAAWLVGTVYSVVLVMILGLIPYIGSMLGSFIAGVTIFTLLGQAYYKVK
jgi:hypothetical protein